MIKFLFGASLACSALVAAAQTFVVPPELWDRPRSARAVLDQPAIREAVNACLARPGSRVVMHHGAGQVSALLAEEMRSWLMALAVDAGRIVLRGDLRPSEPLQLEVIRD
jgi:hypothetical protein